LIGPKIKVLTYFFIIFFVFSIIIFFISFDTYDKNSFLNFIERKVFLRESIDIKNDNIFVLNIENKIDSMSFLNLLYFLKDNTADTVILDLNFSNLIDTVKLNEIKNFIKSNQNIYGYLKLENKKGLKFLNRNYSLDDNLLKNFSYLKTNHSFIYSNYLKDVKIDNEFGIKNKNIGFIYEKDAIFDKNNLNLLYKFENKFVFSLPFLIYCKEKNIDTEEIDFGLTEGVFKDSIFYLDQKGKMSFLHNMDKKEIQINNFLEWKEVLNARSEIVENLTKIEILKSDKKEFDLYKEEEAIIDNLYSYPALKDTTKNTILDLTKNKIGEWKSFKLGKIEKTKKSIFIITQNGDFNWVNNFVYYKNILSFSKNLKRLPISLIIVFSILFLFILLTFGLYSKNSLFFSIIVILLQIILLQCYFIFRIFLGMDFPFLTLVIVLFLGFVFGFLLRSIDKIVWFLEVKTIFGSFVSNNFAEDIARFWKQKKWDLESRQYISTFLLVDTSIFLQNEITEDDIDTIGLKTSEIQQKIKDNYGIISALNTNEVFSYFGNPPIRNEHYKDAINCAYLIDQIPILLNNIPQKLVVAVHSKKEWFKFKKVEGEKHYINFGNSLNTLDAMVKYAKKFGINIIISDSVFKLNSLSLNVRMLDRIKIAGVKNSVRVFEFFTDAQKEKLGNLLDYFHAGLKLFEKRNYEEASSYFRQCLKLKENDIPSQIYLDRCKKYSSNPPDDNWDGCYEIEKI